MSNITSWKHRKELATVDNAIAAITGHVWPKAVVVNSMFVKFQQTVLPFCNCTFLLK